MVHLLSSLAKERDAEALVYALVLLYDNFFYFLKSKWQTLYMLQYVIQCAKTTRLHFLEYIHSLLILETDIH